MAERTVNNSLYIPGGFDVLHKDHKAFIDAAIVAGKEEIEVDNVVIGLVSDKALHGKGKYRPLFSYEWRQEDIQRWYESQDRLDRLEFDPFSPRELLKAPKEQKYRAAVLAAEYEGTRIADVVANAAEKVIYIPAVNNVHTSDLENTLCETRDLSLCDWRVGAVLVRNGEIIEAAHNGGSAPGSCLSCSKRLDLKRIEQDSGHLQPSPVPCDYTHAEARVLKAVAKGDDLFTTTSPCGECAEAIVESGVRRVVYLRPYHSAKEPLHLLEENGIAVRQVGYHQEI